MKAALPTPVKLSDGHNLDVGGRSLRRHPLRPLEGHVPKAFLQALAGREIHADGGDRDAPFGQRVTVAPRQIVRVRRLPADPVVGAPPGIVPAMYGVAEQAMAEEGELPLPRLSPRER